jgi:MFS family permease
MRDHRNSDVSVDLPDVPIAAENPETADGSAVPPAPLRGFAATFRALRHRNYRLYFFGQLISLIGTWVQTVAVTWLAFHLTQQSLWSGLVTAAQIGPAFFLGAWGGVLADRVAKRTLIMVTQAAFLILAVLLAALTWDNTVAPWQLLVITLAGGVVQAVDLPARLSFVIDLAGREDLMNAVALNSMLFNVARTLGPALGGLMLYWLPVWACFLANAVSYVAVLWALYAMDIAGEPRIEHKRNGWHAMMDGFAYLVRHRQLAYLFLLVTTTAICGWPLLSLLPALSQDSMGAGERGYSMMLSAVGLGALAAALMLATFGSLERRRHLLGSGVCVIAFSLVSLSFAPGLILGTMCSGLAGFGLILFFATGQSVAQLTADDLHRGRVMGIWAMTLSGAAPLGNLIAGAAADRWGVPNVLRWLGIGCLAAAVFLLLLYLLTPRLRRLIYK